MGDGLHSVCQRCGQIIQDGMSFCANCGTQVMAPLGQGSYPAQPPPVYSVPPQFAQSPYYPYPGYYMPPNPKRTAAGGGCTLMILDGALALMLTPFLFFEEVPVAGVFMLLACLVAIIGGSLALKGMMPILAAAGPPLLIIGAVWLLFISPFFAMVALIGIVMAVISMALVVYGWSDLMARAEMRNRMARPQ
ncbi:MAG: zinc ribbon domain-containing protein [Candidatus Thermoplasmatota archaeon]|nr:zinc ribbon domain-containing protein [Candidatus Thermoplasmatota archaeon]